MRITVVSGSTRKDSGSSKVSNWIVDRISRDKPNAKVDLIDLKDIKLSLDPDEFWAGESEAAKEMAAAYTKLKDADGVVVVSPEWGGASSPALRQFILMSGYVFAHKPVLLVGVSATKTGGIRPVEDLKHVFKNARGVIVPEPVVVNEVAEFGANTENSSHEKHLEERFDYSLLLLMEYSKALKPVRELEIIDYEKFPFGM